MEMTDTQLIQSILKMQEELISALAEVRRLTEDMTMRHIVNSFEPDSQEEREQVMRFLFNLQTSGITNMMGSDEYIQKRFGFTKGRSLEYLFDYIDNYTELKEQYSKPKIEVEITKKRKGPKPYSEMTPEELAVAKEKARERSASKAEKPEITGDLANRKRTVIRLKKGDEEAHEPKPKGVLIWNAFMNTVKIEMAQENGEEPSYNDLVKKSQELKEADPASYRLFADNWTN